jgi:hypothetical protein
MIMEQRPSYNVGNNHDKGCLDSQLLDTNEDIQNLLAHKLGDHHSSVAPVMAPLIKVGHLHFNQHKNSNIVTIKERQHTPPLFYRTTLSVADQSATSIQSAKGNDASNSTCVTLQLREAAAKTIHHVKSFRTTQAAIPLDVKIAMLEKEFLPAWISMSVDWGEVDYLEGEESSECVDFIKTLSASEVLQFQEATDTYKNQRINQRCKRYRAK